MPNMNPKKLPAREQAPDVRNKNFDEVSQGYDEAMAMEEAARCLNCKHRPCVSGCPVNVRIPEFIQLVKDGKFLEAYDVITSTNGLPAICGRVCPQETQCESRCVRGIKGEPVGIGRLERFVADYAMAHGAKSAEPAANNGKRVAVVGSGPAGLTCAGDLKKLGYDVTVFEALHTPGGVLVYGIPEFRLPKSLVRREISTLEAMGVKIETNMVIGRCISLDELLTDEGFDAVFVGSGAGLPRFPGHPGREPERRVLGQRVFDAHQPHEGVQLPPRRIRRCRSAARWRSWAAVTWRWTPRAAPSAWARRTCTSSIAAARRRCPRAWRRCTTPRRRASSSRC